MIKLNLLSYNLTFKKRLASPPFYYDPGFLLHNSQLCFTYSRALMNYYKSPIESPKRKLLCLVTSAGKLQYFTWWQQCNCVLRFFSKISCCLFTHRNKSILSSNIYFKSTFSCNIDTNLHSCYCAGILNNCYLSRLASKQWRFWSTLWVEHFGMLIDPCLRSIDPFSNAAVWRWALSNLFGRS